MLKGYYYLHFQNYVSKTTLLFNDTLVLIQMYQNVFTTCTPEIICE